MASAWYHHYYRGIMLPAICKAWGLSLDACDPLHEAFKVAFDVDSTSFMDDNDFYNFIDSIHGLLVAEFRTIIPHINEPPNVADITMKEFIDIYKKMKQ